MTIRPTEPKRDAPALVELMRETDPLTVMTVESWHHRESSVPDRAALRAFVAEADGDIVGESYALREWWHSGNAAQIYVAVSERARGRGIGTALYEAAHDHARTLAAASHRSKFFETPAGVAFAYRCGFSEARADRYSAVDPRTVTELPAAEIRCAAEVDRRVLHQIDETSMAGLPGLDPHDPTPFDDWAALMLDRPLFQLHGSFVAFADGRPAAVSFLTADLERGIGTNSYTGTLPEFRGRGLALAAKLGVLHWAAEHGITKVLTLNDETNAPMLAINRRLGYVAAGRRVEFSR